MTLKSFGFVRCASHRAREKLKRALGEEPQGFYPLAHEPKHDAHLCGPASRHGPRVSHQRRNARSLGGTLRADLARVGRCQVKPGDKVGASRWPRDGGPPWSGTLLAVDSPRAWEGSLHFGARRPSWQAARAHVAWCRAQGLLQSTVPVLWHFTRGSERYEVVYWEPVERVRPYKDDLAAWFAARKAA